MAIKVWLSMKDRAARQKAMAAAVKSGEPAKDVAARLGVHWTSVYQACQRFGVRPPNSNGRAINSVHTVVTADEWAKVDWSINNPELALKLGVGSGTVAQVRRKLRKPAALDQKSIRFRQLRDWLIQNREDATELTAGDLMSALPFKVSRELVRSCCKKLGIEPAKRKTAAERMTPDKLKRYSHRDGVGMLGMAGINQSSDRVWGDKSRLRAPSLLRASQGTDTRRSLRTPQL